MAKSRVSPKKQRPAPKTQKARATHPQPKVARLYRNLRAALGAPLGAPALKDALDRNKKAADALDAVVKEMLKK